MEKKLEIKIVDVEESLLVDIHDTYQFNNLKDIIKYKVNPKFPEFIIFEKKFKKETFTLSEKYQCVDLTRTLLFQVIPKEKTINLNKVALNNIIRDFEIDFFVLYDKIQALLFFYSEIISTVFLEKRKTVLPGAKTKIKTKDKKVIKGNPYFLTFENTPSSLKLYEKTVDYIFPKEQNVNDNIKRTLLRSSTNSSFFVNISRTVATFFRRKETFRMDTMFQVLLSFVRSNVTNIKTLTLQMTNIENLQKVFDELPVLEIGKLEESGKILILKIKTSTYSTGVLFDGIDLNEEFFQANYKDFHKIYKDDQIERVETNGTDLTILRHEKRYIRKFQPEINENIQIYIKNISQGIEIQVLLLQSSTIATTEELFAFLKMDPKNFNIQHVETKGIIGSSLIKNPKPVYLASDDQWSAFQPPILGNCIMNNNVFKNFLLLNDSEKISRETPSNYVYYTDPLQAEDNNPILIGGWNKLSSRFGSLTAVLYPTSLKGEDFMNVKILRSQDRQTVSNFLYIMAKLLSYYNTLLLDEIDYFRTMNTEFKLIESREEKNSTKENSLPLLQPQIFTKAIWSRSCQKKNKPPLIISSDEAMTKNQESVIQFPEKDITIDGTFFPSNNYHCYDSEYKYPGFIHMKQLADAKHPFGGYAPCCYKEDHAEKNKAIFAKIRSITVEKEEPDEHVDITMSKKNDISSENIINYTGQHGLLPPKIKKFLTSINPNKEYIRIGLSSIWHRSSLLGCCQYILQKNQLKKIAMIESKTHRTTLETEMMTKKALYQRLPLQKELRNQLVQYSMEIIAQENENLVSIRNDILSSKYRLNVRQLFSLIQYFYKLNLIVIDIEGNFVKPFSTFSFRINFKKEYPLIVLLEHPGNIYEIICSKQEEEVEYTILQNFMDQDQDCFEQWEFIYNVIYSTFECDSFVSAIEDNMKQFVLEKNLSQAIESQIITSNGQTRILMCRFENELLPLFMETPSAPLNLPLEKIIELTEEQTVTRFLESLNISNYETKQRDPFTFFIIPNLFQIASKSKTPMNSNGPFSLTTSMFYKYLLQNKNEFQNIFQLKQISLLIMDYLLICFANFMIVERPTEMNKKMICSDIDEILDLYMTTTIIYVPDKKFQFEDELSPLFIKNPSLYHDGKIYIPQSIEKKVVFMLKWNIINNWEFVKRQAGSQELPSFYLHIFQFKQRQFQQIQLSNKTYTSNMYQSTFHKIESVVMRPLNHVYFLINRENYHIFPCFVSNRNYDKIHSIMNFYFEHGRINFDLENINQKPLFNFQITREKQIPSDLGSHDYFIILIEKQCVVLFNFH